MKRCTTCMTCRSEEFFYKRGDGAGFRQKCIPCRTPANPKKCGPTPRLNPQQRRANKLAAYAKLNAKPERKAKQAFYQKTRECRKKMATPKWLTSTQLAHISAYYETAAVLSAEFGIKFDVDHIIPIKGKSVCGLHVPCNLQVLEHRSNMSKGNRV